MDSLHRFMNDHGISMHGISIQCSQSGGMHIRADQDLAENDIVAVIPKSSVLSTKTTAIADLLEENDIGGLLGLSLALMFEKVQRSSPWCDYIQSLPEREEIPLLWDDAEIEYLKGTDLWNSIIMDREALIEDYETLILPIVQENPDIFSPQSEYSFRQFQNATSLVSSRAFRVDDYHLQSMVPLADVFNHKSMENVHFECNPFTCQFCGEAGICDCDVYSQLDSNQECISDDDDSCPSLSEDNNTEDVSQGSDLMEMVVFRSCKKNSEVFNTYGQSTNAYLLNRYAFCEENNPNDILSLRMDDIMNLLKELPIIKFDQRRGFWDRVGRSLCSRIQRRMDDQYEDDNIQDDSERSEMERDDEFEDDFFLDFNGNLSFDLELFLRLMMVKLSTFLAFVANEAKFVKYADELSKKYNLTNNSSQKTPENDNMSATTNRVIQQLCQIRLDKYSTSLSEDTYLYNKVRLSQDPDKLKHALLLRISEKSIIKRFLIKTKLY